jgi:transcriptional regulator NrdR family protein
MDDHIVAFSTNPEFKPSTSYDNFYQEKMSSLQMMTEIEVIVGKYEKTMTNNTATIVPSLEDIMHEIMDKIKKTYKNRYYRFANKK